MIGAKNLEIGLNTAVGAGQYCWTINSNLSKTVDMSNRSTPDLPAKSQSATAVQSVPETIAEFLAREIASERLVAGQRLIEQQIAQRLEVSRGSVRDALRLLEKRGLIEIYPHRGAIVIGLSLEEVADNGALSSMLIALSSRYIAEQQQPEVLARVAHLRHQVEQMAKRGLSDPMEFATATGRFFANLVTACGNRPLREAMSALLNRLSWEAMWDVPGDMLTIERQREAAEIIGRVADRIAAGDAEGADQTTREFHQRQRDSLLAELCRRRETHVDPSRLISLCAATSPSLSATPQKPSQIEDRLAALERQIARLTGKT
jgi:DNA-binding GntR family transcriptional regulator